MFLNTPKPSAGVKAAWDWRGQPSQVTDKWGRVKSQRQILLDATRVNPESNLAYSTQPTKSERAPR